MKAKKPTSFKILLIVVATVAVTFIIASFFSYYRVDGKYAIALMPFMFIAFALTMVGIYTGSKFKTEDKSLKRFNWVGLLGNLLIFMLVLCTMLNAVLDKAAE